MSFVQLDRQFEPYTNTNGLVTPSLFGSGYQEKCWDDLLELYRVVIIAEANSGKSEEFRQMQKRLSAEGKHAFFVPIEDLCDRELGKCLPPSEYDEFSNWESSTQSGYFFLDSVDEAKLRKKQFRSALVNLLTAIRAGLERAHIFISTRPNDWRSASDQADLDSWLNPRSSKPKMSNTTPKTKDELLLDPILNDHRNQERDKNTGEPRDPFQVTQWRLTPLNQDQHKLFINAKTAGDFEAFEKELRQLGLSHLASTPGDLLMLVKYWNTNQCLAKRQEMSRHLIVEKIAEKKSDDQLSDDRALCGARLVAAALTLCHSFSIKATEFESEHDVENAIEIASILPHWTRGERDSLLRRGVFVPYTFGTLRFQHREIQEYLCASWFRELIDHDCPMPELFALFFPTVNDIEIVAPSLKPIVAWLTLWDNTDTIKREVSKREPAILIDYGDPGSLPPSMRGSLLTSYANQMNSGQVAIGAAFADFGKYRWLFADPALEHEIKEAWCNTKDYSLQMDLLQLIEDGAISNCIEIAEKVSLDQSQRIGLRLLGVNALLACSANDSIKRVAEQLMEEHSGLRADNAADFAIRLYPAFLTTSQLIELVKHCPKPPENVSGGFGYHIFDLWSNCLSDDRSNFIESVTKLVLSPPFAESYRPVSKKYRFLTKQLPRIATEFLSLVDFGNVPPEAYEVLMAIARSDRFDSGYDDIEAIRAIVADHQDFRRELFWQDVARSRNVDKEAAIHHWRIPVNGSIIELSDSDTTWLEDDLRSRASLQDKQLALNALAMVFIRNETIGAKKDHLKSLIGDDLTLNKELEQYAQPPAEEADDRYKQLEKERSVEREKQRQKQCTSWIKFRDEITANSKLILEEASQSPVLQDLTNWLNRKTGERRRYSAGLQWHHLSEAFSEEVATNYQDAMRSLWRTSDVSRPKRDGNISTYLVGDSFAFTGVGVEAQSECWWDVLSPDEAKKAARIACVGEFDYPNWLDELIQHCPEESLPEVEEALRYEFESAEDFPFVLIQRFKYRQHEIPEQAWSIIVKVLADCQFGSARRVEDATQILLRLSLNATQKQTIARTLPDRVRKCDDTTDAVLKMRYLALWFAVEPSKAIEQLETWLSSKTNKAAVNLALDFFGNCIGAHGNGALAAYVEKASNNEIEQILLLAATYVRIEEDNNHEGHWTPNTRDNAQSARNRLIDALTRAPSVESLTTLQRLAQNPVMKSYQHWLTRHARGVAEKVGEITPWSPDHVIRFKNDFVTPIRNAGTLFKVVCNVLANINHELANSDSSSKRLLDVLGRTYQIKNAVKQEAPDVLSGVKTSDEAAVQDWLAEQLRLRANKRFHAYREAHVADEKRPDVIAADTQSRFEVAIEVKQADSWTTNQLIEALEIQLAETYLRPESRRHGVLFMTDSGRKKWEHPETTKPMNFEELTWFLSGLAEKKTSNAVGSISVSVVGFDIKGDYSRLFKAQGKS